MAQETLTFLFTDLEGSTRLWEEHPDQMRVALAQHDDLVREAVEQHGGRVVKSTGDGVLATFGAAQDGVDAAVDAQVALVEAAWPEHIELRVRMGIHAGQATERAGDWFGSDVNRAARVTAVAHGGQIICTGVVGEQVRDRHTLADLGEHRLRDLQSPVHLFQIDAPGLPNAFPPLRSLDAYRSNLPYELSSFVGRDEELRSIAGRLRSSRVVSIVGVGGVGKTRMALQVASELLPHYPDGVWLCELAQVLDADDLPDAVAAALGYAPPQGVSVAEGLPQYLERKVLLLVLDNCEHLVSAVASFVSATTTVAAEVSILATSREALGVRGEHISPLGSLELPESPDAGAVLASSAGGLFVTRASEARGELVLDDTSARAVHDLCARLDGIPLAIELAAAQTRVMSPTEILQRLDQQFRLLTGGQRTSLERHQTLRAAIDWSYDLLSTDERSLLNRLSVCVGGFDLDAAAATAAGIGVEEFDAFDLLGSLVAKSLVERNERDGTTRYRLLEMIRQYAAERLNAAGDSKAARDGHATHYLALATRLFATTGTAGDYAAMALLDLECANIAAAGRWLLATDRVPELLLFFDSLAFLDPFAMPVTPLDELGAIAVEAIRRPDAEALPGFYATFWMGSCRAFFTGELTAYRELHELVRRGPDAESQWTVLLSDATIALFDGDLDRNLEAGRRAVAHARRGGDLALLSWTLGYMSPFESWRDPDVGLAVAEEAVAVARRSDSTVMLQYPLIGLMTATSARTPARCLEAAEECVRIDRSQRRLAASTAEGQAASIRIRNGDVAAGLELWREVLRAYAERGERSVFVVDLGALAGALARIAPTTAINLAAVAESDAITHYAAFITPQLSPFVDERPTEVEAARARAGRMSYDDAMLDVFATIEELIAEHRDPRGSPGLA